MAWIRVDPQMAGGYVPLIEYGNDSPFIGFGSNRPMIYQGALLESALTPGWHHVAYRLLADDQVTAIMVDGAKWDTRLTGNLNMTGEGLGIGNHVGDGWFRGNICNLFILPFDREGAVKYIMNQYKPLSLLLSPKGIDYVFRADGSEIVRRRPDESSETPWVSISSDGDLNGLVSKWGWLFASDRSHIYKLSYASNSGKWSTAETLWSTSGGSKIWSLGKVDGALLVTLMDETEIRINLAGDVITA